MECFSHSFLGLFADVEIILRQAYVFSLNVLSVKVLIMNVSIMNVLIVILLSVLEIALELCYIQLHELSTSEYAWVPHVCKSLLVETFSAV